MRFDIIAGVPTRATAADVTYSREVKYALEAAMESRRAVGQ